MKFLDEYESKMSNYPLIFGNHPQTPLPCLFVIVVHPPLDMKLNYNSPFQISQEWVDHSSFDTQKSEMGNNETLDANV